MFEKLKVEKVELVKRVIRQNNYEQYERTYKQCIDLGFNINRTALERFANKLELIDKAQLSKRQYELHKLELAEQNQKEQKRQQQRSIAQHAASTNSQELRKDHELDEHLDSLSMLDEQRSYTPPTQQKRRVPKKPNEHSGMSYEQVKQRETEITFELGELKIKENQLLQELIRLTELLDKNQAN